MASIEQFDGVRHVPLVVRQHRQALHNHAHQGILDESAIGEVTSLLTDAERLYPKSYTGGVPNPVWDRMAFALRQLPARLQEAVHAVSTEVLKPSFVALEYQYPVEPVQGLAKQVKESAELGTYWRSELHISAALGKNDASSFFSDGVTLRLPDQTEPFLQSCWTYAARGPLTDSLSFHLGSALVPGERSDLQHLLDCSTMAATLTQAMSGQLDAALAALSDPSNRNEVMGAVRHAYNPSWYTPIEKARHMLFRQPPPSMVSGVSMTSMLWFQDQLLVVQSGLNSLYVLGSDKVDGSVEPAVRPQGQALGLLAKRRYSPQLHNSLALAQSHKGLFTSDVQGHIRASVRRFAPEALRGRLLILSNIPLRGVLSEDEIVAAGQQKKCEAVARALLNSVREHHFTSEVSISVLAFKDPRFSGVPS